MDGVMNGVMDDVMDGRQKSAIEHKSSLHHRRHVTVSFPTSTKHANSSTGIYPDQLNLIKHFRPQNISPSSSSSSSDLPPSVLMRSNNHQLRGANETIAPQTADDVIISVVTPRRQRQTDVIASGDSDFHGSPAPLLSRDSADSGPVPPLAVSPPPALAEVCSTERIRSSPLSHTLPPPPSPYPEPEFSRSYITGSSTIPMWGQPAADVRTTSGLTPFLATPLLPPLLTRSSPLSLSPSLRVRQPALLLQPRKEDVTSLTARSPSSSLPPSSGVRRRQSGVRELTSLLPHVINFLPSPTTTAPRYRERHDNEFVQPYEDVSDDDDNEKDDDEEEEEMTRQISGLYGLPVRRGSESSVPVLFHPAVLRGLPQDRPHNDALLSLAAANGTAEGSQMISRRRHRTVNQHRFGNLPPWFELGRNLSELAEQRRQELDPRLQGGVEGRQILWRALRKRAVESVNVTNLAARNLSGGFSSDGDRPSRSFDIKCFARSLDGCYTGGVCTSMSSINRTINNTTNNTIGNTFSADIGVSSNSLFHADLVSRYDSFRNDVSHMSQAQAAHRKIYSDESHSIRYNMNGQNKKPRDQRLLSCSPETLPTSSFIYHSLRTPSPVPPQFRSPRAVVVRGERNGAGAGADADSKPTKKFPARSGLFKPYLDLTITETSDDIVTTSQPSHDVTSTESQHDVSTTERSYESRRGEENLATVAGGPEITHVGSTTANCDDDDDDQVSNSNDNVDIVPSGVRRDASGHESRKASSDASYSASDSASHHVTSGHASRCVPLLEKHYLSRVLSGHQCTEQGDLSFPECGLLHQTSNNNLYRAHDLVFPHRHGHSRTFSDIPETLRTLPEQYGRLSDPSSKTLQNSEPYRFLGSRISITPDVDHSGYSGRSRPPGIDQGYSSWGHDVIRRIRQNPTAATVPTGLNPCRDGILSNHIELNGLDIFNRVLNRERDVSSHLRESYKERRRERKGEGEGRMHAKRYPCDLCGRTFSRSNTLVTHRRIHTGEKPFVCSDCGRSFRQPGNLTRHRLTHTSCKPYTCPVCGKSFNRASNLHTHMRTHDV